MKLQAAIESGKRFRVTASSGAFKTASQFTSTVIPVTAFNADYELEVINVSVPENLIIAAWNEGMGSRTGVAAAPGGGYYNDFKAKLLAKGISLS